MISFLYYYLDIETLSPTSTSLAVIWFRSMRGLRGPNAAKTKSIAMRECCWYHAFVHVILIAAF
jgi:hypothetical protein